MSTGVAVNGECVGTAEAAHDAYYSAIPVFTASDGSGGFKLIRYEADSGSVSGWLRSVVSLDSSGAQTAISSVDAPLMTFPTCNLSLASEFASMTAADSALIAAAIIGCWVIGWAVGLAARMGSQQHD